jgi:hypothetical protein
MTSDRPSQLEGRGIAQTSAASPNLRFEKSPDLTRFRGSIQHIPDRTPIQGMSTSEHLIEVASGVPKGTYEIGTGGPTGRDEFFVPSLQHLQFLKLGRDLRCNGVKAYGDPSVGVDQPLQEKMNARGRQARYPM